MNGEKMEQVPKAKSNWSLVLGLFFGIGLGATLGVVGLEYFHDKVTFLVIFLVAILIFIAALFSVVAFNKEQILNHLFGGAKGSLDEAIRSSVDALQEFSNGEHSAGSNSATHALREAAALYTWSRFRWLVATLFLALIASIATFSSSMLVFRQNELIQDQNDLFEKERDLLLKQQDLVNKEIVIYQGEIENQKLQLRSNISQQASKIYELVDKEMSMKTSHYVVSWEQNLKKLDAILKDQALVGGSWDEFKEYSGFDSFEKKHTLIADSKVFYDLAWSKFYMNDYGYGADAKADVFTPDILKILKSNDFRKALHAITVQLALSNNPSEPRKIAANTQVHIANFLDSLSSRGRLHAEAYREAKADLLLGLIRLRADLEVFQDDFDSISFKNRTIAGFNIQSLNLSDATFGDVIFRNAKFLNCDLSDAKFTNCSFENCRFTKSFLPAPENFVDCSFDWTETFHEAYVNSFDWLSRVEGIGAIESGHVRAKYAFQYYPFESKNVLGNPIELGLTSDIRGKGYSVEIRKKHPEIEGNLSGIGDVFFKRDVLAIVSTRGDLIYGRGPAPSITADMGIEANIVWTFDGWPMSANEDISNYALAFQSKKHASVIIRDILPSENFSFDSYRQLQDQGAKLNSKIEFKFPLFPVYAKNPKKDEKQ